MPLIPLKSCEVCVDPVLLIGTEDRAEGVLPIVRDCPESFRVVTCEDLGNKKQISDVEGSSAQCRRNSESTLEITLRSQDGCKVRVTISFKTFVMMPKMGNDLTDTHIISVE